MKRKRKKQYDYYKCADYYPLLANPDKYVGKRPITIRSNFERKFAKFRLDGNPDVVEWTSEDIRIPYIYEVDGRKKSYYPDFWFKMKDGKEFIIEIKPSYQCSPPKKKNPKRLAEYIKNMNKWNACDAFVGELQSGGRNIEFGIITEKTEPLFRDKTFG